MERGAGGRKAGRWTGAGEGEEPKERGAAKTTGMKRKAPSSAGAFGAPPAPAPGPQADAVGAGAEEQKPRPKAARGGRGLPRGAPGRRWPHSSPLGGALGAPVHPGIRSPRLKAEPGREGRALGHTTGTPPAVASEAAALASARAAGAEGCAGAGQAGGASGNGPGRPSPVLSRSQSLSLGVRPGAEGRGPGPKARA